MRTRSGSHSIEISIAPRSNNGSPARARVSVSVGGFRGLNSAVSFTAGRLAAFAKQLATLEGGEVNRAQLVGEDPTLFALTIEVLKPAGIQVRGHLAASEGPGAEVQMEFRFPVERDALARLLRDLTSGIA